MELAEETQMPDVVEKLSEQCSERPRPVAGPITGLTVSQRRRNLIPYRV